MPEAEFLDWGEKSEVGSYLPDHPAVVSVDGWLPFKKSNQTPRLVAFYLSHSTLLEQLPLSRQHFLFRGELCDAGYQEVGWVVAEADF